MNYVFPFLKFFIMIASTFTNEGTSQVKIKKNAETSQAA